MATDLTETITVTPVTMETIPPILINNWDRRVEIETKYLTNVSKTNSSAEVRKGMRLRPSRSLSVRLSALERSTVAELNALMLRIANQDVQIPLYSDITEAGALTGDVEGFTGNFFKTRFFKDARIAHFGVIDGKVQECNIYTVKDASEGLLQVNETVAPLSGAQLVVPLIDIDVELSGLNQSLPTSQVSSFEMNVNEKKDGSGLPPLLPSIANPTNNLAFSDFFSLGTSPNTSKWSSSGASIYQGVCTLTAGNAMYTLGTAVSTVTDFKARMNLSKPLEGTAEFRVYTDVSTPYYGFISMNGASVFAGVDLGGAKTVSTPITLFNRPTYIEISRTNNTLLFFVDHELLFSYVSPSATLGTDAPVVRMTIENTDDSLSMEIDSANVYSTSGEYLDNSFNPPEYVNIPILGTPHNWADNFSISVTRGGTVIPLGRGRVTSVDSTRPQLEFQIQGLFTREEFFDLLLFFEWARGRMAPFWFLNRSTLWDVGSISGNVITITKDTKDASDFSSFFPYIALRGREGSSEILTVESVVDQTTSLAITTTTTPSDTSYPYLTSAHLVRFNSDALREIWTTREVCEVSFSLNELLDSLGDLDTSASYFGGYSATIPDNSIFGGSPDQCYLDADKGIYGGNVSGDHQLVTVPVCPESETWVSCKDSSAVAVLQGGYTSKNVAWICINGALVKSHKTGVTTSSYLNHPIIEPSNSPVSCDGAEPPSLEGTFVGEYDGDGLTAGAKASWGSPELTGTGTVVANVYDVNANRGTMRFNGTSNYFEAATSSVLNITGAFTLYIVCKKSSDGAYIVNKGENETANNNQFAFSLRGDNGKFMFRVGSGTTNYTIEVDGDEDLHLWTCSYNGSDRIYLRKDGVAVSDIAAPSSLNNTSDKFTIGAHSGSSGGKVQMFDGDIPQVEMIDVFHSGATLESNELSLMMRWGIPVSCTSISEIWRSADTAAVIAAVPLGYISDDYAWLCVGSAWVKAYSAETLTTPSTSPAYLLQCGGSTPSSTSDLVGWPVSDDFSGTGCNSGAVADADWAVRGYVNQAAQSGTTVISSNEVVATSPAAAQNVNSSGFHMPGATIVGDFYYKTEVDFVNIGNGRYAFYTRFPGPGSCSVQFIPSQNTTTLYYNGSGYYLGAYAAVSLVEVTKTGTSWELKLDGVVKSTRTATASIASGVFSGSSIQVLAGSTGTAVLKTSSIILQDGLGASIYFDPAGSACTTSNREIVLCSDNSVLGAVAHADIPTSEYFYVCNSGTYAKAHLGGFTATAATSFTFLYQCGTTTPTNCDALVGWPVSEDFSGSGCNSGFIGDLNNSLRFTRSTTTNLPATERISGGTYTATLQPQSVILEDVFSTVPLNLSGDFAVAFDIVIDNVTASAPIKGPGVYLAVRTASTQYNVGWVHWAATNGVCFYNGSSWITSTVNDTGGAWTLGIRRVGSSIKFYVDGSDVGLAIGSSDIVDLQIVLANGGGGSGNVSGCSVAIDNLTANDNTNSDGTGNELFTDISGRTCIGSNREIRLCDGTLFGAVVTADIPTNEFFYVCNSGVYAKARLGGLTATAATTITPLYQCGTTAPTSCEELVGWPASDDFSGTECNSGFVGDLNWNLRWLADTATWSISSGGAVSSPADTTENILDNNMPDLSGDFSFSGTMSSSDFPDGAGESNLCQANNYATFSGGSITWGFLASNSSFGNTERKGLFISRAGQSDVYVDTTSLTNRSWTLSRTGSTITLNFGGVDYTYTHSGDVDRFLHFTRRQAGYSAWSCAFSALVIQDGSSNEVYIDIAGKTCVGSNREIRLCDGTLFGAVVTADIPTNEFFYVCNSGVYAKARLGGLTATTATTITPLYQCGTTTPTSCEELVGWPVSDDFSGTGCNSGFIGDLNNSLRFTRSTTTNFLITEAITGGKYTASILSRAVRSEDITYASTVSVSGDFTVKADIVVSNISAPGPLLGPAVYLWLWSGTTQYILGWLQNANAFGLAHYNGSSWIQDETNYTGGSWTFEIRRVGSTLTFYINGVSKGTASQSGVFTSFRFGAGNGGGGGGNLASVDATLDNFVVNDNSNGDGTGGDIFTDISGKTCVGSNREVRLCSDNSVFGVAAAASVPTSKYFYVCNSGTYAKAHLGPLTSTTATTITPLYQCGTTTPTSCAELIGWPAEDDFTAAGCDSATISTFPFTTRFFTTKSGTVSQQIAAGQFVQVINNVGVHWGRLHVASSIISLLGSADFEITITASHSGTIGSGIWKMLQLDANIGGLHHYMARANNEAYPGENGWYAENDAQTQTAHAVDTATSYTLGLQRVGSTVLCKYQGSTVLTITGVSGSCSAIDTTSVVNTSSGLLTVNIDKVEVFDAAGDPLYIDLAGKTCT